MYKIGSASHPHKPTLKKAKIPAKVGDFSLFALPVNNPLAIKPDVP
jgi:hypothetical protein